MREAHAKRVRLGMSAVYTGRGFSNGTGGGGPDGQANGRQARGQAVQYIRAYIPACGRRVSLLATCDSPITFQQTQQIGAALIEISRYVSQSLRVTDRALRVVGNLDENHADNISSTFMGNLSDYLSDYLSENGYHVSGL